MLKDYSLLPDYMEVEDLKREFRSLLLHAKIIKDNVGFSEALYELAIRQWHTYKVIENSLKDEINNWIIENFNFNSLEITESLIGVIGNLGLEKSYEYIKESISKDININKDVKHKILEAINEFGESVSNPYMSLD